MRKIILTIFLAMILFSGCSSTKIEAAPQLPKVETPKLKAIYPNVLSVGSYYKQQSGTYTQNQKIDTDKGIVNQRVTYTVSNNIIVFAADEDFKII